MHPTDAEEWRWIVGYEGRYQVSDQGRVRSFLKWRDTQVPRLRSFWPNRFGYWVVALSDGNVCREIRVHVEVARAFHGPRPKRLEIRHLNGNKLDNRAENLQYGTSRENKLDVVRHGAHHEVLRTHCPEGHEYTEANTYRRHDHRNGRHCRRCDRNKHRVRRGLAPL